MMKSRLSYRLPGPIALVLVALAPVAFGGACATAVSTSATGSSGAGGGSGGGGGAGGGTATASSSTGPMGPCVMAADCAFMNDICNSGTCINGTCQKAPANEFGSCDDGKFCTEADVCQKGVCVGGSAKYCAPSDTCHIGTCDEAAQTCKTVPGNDGAQCDDMDPCTGSGSCSNGTCSKGSQVDCSVFNGECTVGVCDPVKGCQPTPTNEGGPCNDGSGNNCSQGICNLGMCVSQPKNDGAPCDDTKYCTINDHCAIGKCVGDPNPCAPPNNPCQIGVCNENAKSCVTNLAPNGQACSTNNLCLTAESCLNGQCQGGSAANNGVACDDGNGCTGGTTCQGGLCTGATSNISMCMTGDNCCPAGCALQTDADCLYYVPGVQQNVPEATLQGWQKCWTGTYADSSPAVSQVLSMCSKQKLLMACRQVGQPNWKLLAMAPRADVLFDCGQTTNCTKQSNGVGWYFNDSYSWGFAPGGEPVNRFSCDYNQSGMQTVPDQRLCWHTGGQSINTGYRCGDNDLNSDSTWERAVYQAD